MPRAGSEKHVIICAQHRRDSANANNGSFIVNYNNAAFMQSTVGFRVKSVTLANMFPNIYGMSCTLYLRRASGIVAVTIPEARLTAAELASALTSKMSTFTDPIDAKVSSENRFIFACVAPSVEPFTVLGSLDISDLKLSRDPMNGHIGAGTLTQTMATSILMPFLPGLYGPPIVFIHSERLAMMNSVSSDASPQSTFASVSLAQKPYGELVYNEVAQYENSLVWFSDDRQLNYIDIRVADCFGQTLTLPPNAPVMLEIIISVAG